MTHLEQHLDRFTSLRSIKVPRIMRVVTAMILTTLIGATLFLVFVPWVQTTSAPGQVTALSPDDREQSITALVPGRIEQWFVRDGSSVKRGDPIVRLADVDPQLIQRLQAERAQVEVQLSAATTGLATAQLDLDRMRELFGEGLAARRDYEQAQIRVQDFRSRLAEARANLNRVDVNVSRQSVQTVFAPRDGFIQSLNAGDTATLVSAGATLATFVPEFSERVIEVFISGRDVALVQPGGEARIQFEGWPVVQFSGWPSVAVGTFHGIVSTVDPSARRDGSFRVLISEDPNAPDPWPAEQFVRYGAGVRAWILFETVPVGYEIWRQLNSFPPQMTAGAREASGMSSGTSGSGASSSAGGPAT